MHRAILAIVLCSAAGATFGCAPASVPPVSADHPAHPDATAAPPDPASDTLALDAQPPAPAPAASQQSTSGHEAHQHDGAVSGGNDHGGHEHGGHE